RSRVRLSHPPSYSAVRRGRFGRSSPGARCARATIDPRDARCVDADSPHDRSARSAARRPARPRRRPNELAAKMTGRKYVGRMSRHALPPGTMKRLDYPPFHVLVVNLGGVPYAIDDTCNHAGESLAKG